LFVVFKQSFFLLHITVGCLRWSANVGIIINGLLIHDILINLPFIVGGKEVILLFEQNNSCNDIGRGGREFKLLFEHFNATNPSGRYGSEDNLLYEQSKFDSPFGSGGR
jgi:hypothetical protein